ncbi:MAG: hypothetical protein GX986_06940 [Firmicutes bacterium]|nr:hypothetical protein [Bacillota bacterium]
MSNSLKNHNRKCLNNPMYLNTTFYGPVQVIGDSLGEGANAIVYPVQFGGPAAVKILAEEVTEGKPST